MNREPVKKDCKFESEVTRADVKLRLLARLHSCSYDLFFAWVCFFKPLIRSSLKDFCFLLLVNQRVIFHILLKKKLGKLENQSEGH